MNHFVFATILCVLYSATGTAQDQISSSNDTLLTKRSSIEISVDLLPLIDKSTDDFGLLFRKHYQDKALRIKLAPGYRRTANPNPDFSGSETKIFVSVGYEWIKKVGRLMPYYGADIYTRTYLSQTKQVNNGLTISRQNSIRLGLSGFIGARYQITKTLGVSLENHFFAEYYSLLSENDIAKSDNRYFEIGLRPIQAIYLSYFF